MPIRISYMGTKRLIAPAIGEVISNCQKGALLDIFSGICAVATQVAPIRNVWCNDIQVFASSVAQAFFTSQDSPMNSVNTAEFAKPYFEKNFFELEKRLHESLSTESELSKRSSQFIKSFYSRLPCTENLKSLHKERLRLNKKINTFPYRLFSITYAGTYFGIRQCVEIDSIRYAIDKLRLENIITAEQKLWMLVALCQALCRAATSTGHYAQFSQPNPKTRRRYLNYRDKSIWTEWLCSIGEYAPTSTREWRAKNKVFRNSASELLRILQENDLSPAVIYADPPYTDDQYSRFYHIYETLILYDYPSVSGFARYRSKRFTSPFSLKSQVATAFDDLVKGSSQLGAELVLSYPSNGLLADEAGILDLLKRHYSHVEIAEEIQSSHSSMGASKGAARHSVTEKLYWAA